MIYDSNLETAIEYRDRLKALRTFKLDLWDGLVGLSFGSYEMVVSAKSTKDELLALIAAEERMLRNTLEMWGVKLEDDRQ